MRREVVFLFLAVIGLMFSSCEKEDYFIVNPISEEEETQISKVFYTYSPISTKSTKDGQDGEKTGEVIDGDSLNFETPGTLVFHTMPQDTTCTWNMGGNPYVQKDQILHGFNNYGNYNCSVVGENTNLRNFTVVIKEDEGDDDDDDPIDTTSYNIALISKTDRGNYWELIFNVKNQFPGYDISGYGHVGNGYTGASWTPQNSNITNHPTLTNVLVFSMSIPKTYNGKVKFCLTFGSNWFNPNLDSLGGVFWNTSTANDPNEQIWQFNVIGNSCAMTSWDGVTISPAGENTMPGKMNDGLIGFTINNQVGGDESLTIYVKSPNSNELRYASDSTSHSTIPVQLTALQLEGVVGYDDWKKCTIPRNQIKKYLWFHFGTNTSNIYTRSIACDESDLFVESQLAFRIMG